MGSIVLPPAAAGAAIACPECAIVVIGAVTIYVAITDEDFFYNKDRKYITYKLYNEEGQVYYGRSSGFKTVAQIVANRMRSHHRESLEKGGFDTKNVVIDKVATAAENGKRAIRGREQQLIDQHPDGIENPMVGNSIRAVAMRNPFGFRYWQASNAAFGNIAPYTGY